MGFCSGGAAKRRLAGFRWNEVELDDEQMCQFDGIVDGIGQFAEPLIFGKLIDTDEQSGIALWSSAGEWLQ